MFNNNIDYLIYSSHKTCSQSLKNTLNNNSFLTTHLHTIDKNNYINFKNYCYGYNKKNKKKLVIITILRNPFDRLKSSFFQTFHSDQVSFLNVDENNTFINKNNLDFLFDIFCNKILNYKREEEEYLFNRENEIVRKGLPGMSESLFEIDEIFDYDIINNLEIIDNYYYYENNLIKLYVLSFDKLINNDYLKTIFNINNNLISTNLSSYKIYNEKYIDFKKLVLSDEIKNIIDNYYNLIFELLNKINNL